MVEWRLDHEVDPIAKESSDRGMTTTTLAEQLRSSPESERLELAQVLWESLDVNPFAVVPDPVREAVEQARVRNLELDAGVIAGRIHEDVMAALRREL